jgi:hypothetical protein
MLIKECKYSITPTPPKEGGETTVLLSYSPFLRGLGLKKLFTEQSIFINRLIIWQ